MPSQPRLGCVTEYRLIPVTPVYAEVLAALHATAFEAPWDADALAALMLVPAALTLLAVASGDDTPIGFILIQPAGDEADIMTLAVTPAHRRHGVARRLIVAASDDLRARGVGRLVLEVAVGNRAARDLYASLGFQQVGLRKGYYRRPHGVEDAAVLSRLIRAPT